MINPHKSHRQWVLWLLAGVMSLLAFAVYRRTSSLKAEAVFSLMRGAKGDPVNGWPSYGLPNKGYLRAGIASDQKGFFYLATSQKDAEQEKRVAHPRHADIISMLVVDTKGNTQRVVPLKRKDGRYVRHLCEFLSVSPSGKKWWTARTPYESPSDLQEGSGPNGVVNAYGNDGAVLQEWTLPTDIGSIMLVGAVGEDRVYVVSQQNVGQKGKIWIYRLGHALPQELPYPSNWFPVIGGSLITPEGQFWCLVSGMSDVVEVRVAQLTQPTRVLTSFKWHREGYSPYLFWADDKSGLFGFENFKDEKGQIRWADGAKAIYRIAPDGTVHKLFETPDVLPAKPNQQARAGQLLKADAKFVWMEVSYLKDGKVTEYQIVKVPYR